MKRWPLYLAMLPALIVLGPLFYGGLAAGLGRSLGYAPLIGQTELSGAAWRAVLTAPEVRSSAMLTFYIAAISTILATVLGVGAALLMRHRFAGARAARLLFQINLTVPHLVLGTGILYLFSQSGLFARLAAQMHLISVPADFPALIWDPAALGIILAYVVKEVPFIGLVAMANLQAIGPDYEQAARSLGARPWQAARYVLLPAIRPGIISSAAIVFAFTFGAYEIPALLGASHPLALPVLAWQRFNAPDLAARPEAMALALLIAALSGLVVWVVLRAGRAQRRLS